MCFAPAFHHGPLPFVADFTLTLRSVRNFLCNARHEDIVVDSIEEFLKVYVYNPVIVLLDIVPRLHDCLLCATPFYDAITVL